jgi:hypothetical protein
MAIPGQYLLVWGWLDEHRGTVAGGTMREVLLPIGLATGIGSLPHEDAEEAVRFALERQPRGRGSRA